MNHWNRQHIYVVPLQTAQVCDCVSCHSVETEAARGRGVIFGRRELVELKVNLTATCLSSLVTPPAPSVGTRPPSPVLPYHTPVLLLHLLVLGPHLIVVHTGTTLEQHLSLLDAL